MIGRIVAAGGILMLAWPAAAQTGSGAERVLAQMVACRQTADVAARARCYDQALDRLQQQVADRQVVIVDHEQVAQDRKATFGFSSAEHLQKVQEARAPKPPRPPKGTRPAKPPMEDVAEIDTTILSAKPYGYEEWTLALANGAIWRTTESGIVVAPRPGTKVHIHRALLNSYFLRVGGGKAVRAMRVG